MNIPKSIPILLLSFLSIFMFVNLELAHSSLSSEYETQIFHESNESKVKKLQNVFAGLGLYSGEISGVWADIGYILIDYQIAKGIVAHAEADEAGYFGPKTMKALEEEFGQSYLDLKEEFLKIDEITNHGRFQITAYYTPQSGQAKYTTGTYAGDVRLNGDSTTASSIPLQPGLLAAPRNYPFNTRIYIEGLGIGIVGDRGGAIVNSGERGNEYDRLDIWMGYGDEGRERARQWGRREVVGYVVEDNYIVNMEFDSTAEGLFKEKYLEDCEQEGEVKFESLTDKDKQDMEAVKALLEKKFSELFSGNTAQLEAFKQAFKERLNTIANSEKYAYRKLELDYLIEIL